MSEASSQTGAHTDTEPGASASALLDELEELFPDRVTARWRRPARAAQETSWPSWANADLVDQLVRSGISAPWRHQVLLAELLQDGQSAVIATGTASGKSLGYLLPAVSAALAPPVRPGIDDRSGVTIYLAPTKALAADQLSSLLDLKVPGLRPATYDGDTPQDDRAWVRRQSNYILTNPDMLSRSVLPAHDRWKGVLSRLSYVVVDECHVYKGVFGSHVANVLRRLVRVARHYGADPVFALASATTANASQSASKLVGQPVESVTEDSSPHPGLTIALWEPPQRDDGERRSALSETADLLTELTLRQTPTLAFARSRAGVETVAAMVRDSVEERGADPRIVAAYRGGYLPEERRAIESQLRDGRLVSVAATNALELGIDVSGLDAVLIAGWPGTRASLWQQAGRAGRASTEALAVFIGRDDPLDTYVLHHPEMLRDAEVEETVFDPGNPHVLEGHLAAAASELPLTESDLAAFGPHSRELVDRLVAEGRLRVRPRGWFWTDRVLPRVDLRGINGQVVRVVEPGTGRLLGTVDPARAMATVHAGAVYVHQGATHVVTELDLADGVAWAVPTPVDYYTVAGSTSDFSITRTLQFEDWGRVRLHFGEVRVSSRVVDFTRRRTLTGETLGREELDLPERTLSTTAVWWTFPELEVADVAGAIHAAEHAAIGLLGLFANCDRWDIGGVSSPHHPDTGAITIMVYDGADGGAGFAARGFETARAWVRATREAIAVCDCVAGCPACVQSPKCGNGNEPLDKNGAIQVWDVALADA